MLGSEKAGSSRAETHLGSFWRSDEDFSVGGPLFTALQSDWALCVSAKEDTKRVNPLSFPVTSHRTVTGVSRGNG